MNPPDASATGPKPLETLLGHADLTVTRMDGSTEQVQVRQLPIREYPAYLSVQLDEPAMVEMLCGKQPGWADHLTTESVEMLVAAGEVLNADFFGRWVRRRMARQERLIPGSVLASLGAGDINGTATLQTTSPTSPSPGAGSSRS